LESFQKGDYDEILLKNLDKFEKEFSKSSIKADEDYLSDLELSPEDRESKKYDSLKQIALL